MTEHSGPGAPSALIVWSTFADEETATEVARALVRERLVACAQTTTAPVRSIYRWKGEVQEDEETLLLMKTTVDRWAKLVERLGQLHPYEVPEILGCPAHASAAYQGWMERQVQAFEGS